MSLCASWKTSARSRKCWRGDPRRVPVRMNGLQLEADLRHGQKTGVYLDQRENYVAAARWARTRGWTSPHRRLRAHGAVVRLRGRRGLQPGCAQGAEANRAANGLGNVTFHRANAFDYLSGLATYRRGSRPWCWTPAFAKSKSNLEAAMRGYKEDQLQGAEAAFAARRAGDVLVLASRGKRT